MRVLIVEDEKKTASFIRKALQAEGFAVDVCHNGDDALAAARVAPYDGIVLDIMLPGRDGLSVLRQLRERKNATPVLLLSARGEVNERVEGLNAGADDYLPKPFELAELIARVRALTRRSAENKSNILRVADLVLDTITHRAQRGETDIELTAREYRLLEFLMRSPGRAHQKFQQPELAGRQVKNFSAAPYAMDQVNLDAFQEAYKDLINLANLAMGGGEPVR